MHSLLQPAVFQWARQNRLPACHKFFMKGTLQVTWWTIAELSVINAGLNNTLMQRATWCAKESSWSRCSYRISCLKKVSRTQICRIHTGPGTTALKHTQRPSEVYHKQQKPRGTLHGNIFFFNYKGCYSCCVDATYSEETWRCCKHCWFLCIVFKYRLS